MTATFILDASFIYHLGDFERYCRTHEKGTPGMEQALPLEGMRQLGRAGGTFVLPEEILKELTHHQVGQPDQAGRRRYEELGLGKTEDGKAYLDTDLLLKGKGETDGPTPFLQALQILNKEKRVRCFASVEDYQRATLAPGTLAIVPTKELEVGNGLETYVRTLLELQAQWDSKHSGYRDPHQKGDDAIIALRDALGIKNSGSTAHCLFSDDYELCDRFMKENGRLPVHHTTANSMLFYHMLKQLKFGPPAKLQSMLDNYVRHLYTLPPKEREKLYSPQKLLLEEKALGAAFVVRNDLSLPVEKAPLPELSAADFEQSAKPLEPRVRKEKPVQQGPSKLTTLSKFYRFEGDEGPAMEQTKAAFERLLDAGFGERLLRTAYDRRGTPVTIHVRPGQTGYENAAGEHTVFFDPDALLKSSAQAADGSMFVLSLEATLGHELTHAASALANNLPRYNMLERQRERLVNNARDPEKIAQMQERIKHAQNTPYNFVGHQQIGKVREQLTEIGDEVIEKTKNDPQMLEYIKEVEAASLETEAAVQRHFGLPVRKEYLAINVGDQVRDFSEQLDKTIDWDAKTNLSPRNDWQRYVAGGGDIGLQKPETEEPASQESNIRNWWRKISSILSGRQNDQTPPRS